MNQDPCFVPELRPDLIRRDLGLEAVAWSPEHPWPVALDPASRVMLDVIDGSATISDLVADVQDVVGIATELAQAQVNRIIDRFDRGGLLTTSRPDPAPGVRSVFVSPASSCMETSSCTGKVTSVNLQIAGQPIRVACASAKVARRLRNALHEHVIDEQAPLGFMLRAPHRRQRDHVLVDRGGFTLGTARSVDAAVAMIASHLAVLHPPAAGRVRLRLRALLREGTAVLCPFPVLFAPPLDEGLIRSTGHTLLDRLAVDIDPASNSLATDPVPWAGAGNLRAPEGHAGSGEVSAQIHAIVVARAPGATSSSTMAELVAMLATERLSGDRDTILEVAVGLVTACVAQEVELQDSKGVGAALERLAQGS